MLPAHQLSSRLLSTGVCATKPSLHNVPPALPSNPAVDARRCLILYDRALRFARHENYKGARRAFQTCVAVDPDFSKAWVSWAQMEKRLDIPDEADNLQRCRRVLQRGLSLNPTDAKLLQAWGLMELKRGNVWAAVLLLERCVRYEPKCSPVLQWRAVQEARQILRDRLQQELPQMSIIGQRHKEQNPPIALP